MKIEIDEIFGEYHCDAFGLVFRLKVRNNKNVFNLIEISEINLTDMNIINKMINDHNEAILNVRNEKLNDLANFIIRNGKECEIVLMNEIVNENKITFGNGTNTVRMYPQSGDVFYSTGSDT